MNYQDLIVSGKSASQTIASGESGANIIVRNSAVLRLGAGGYISNTTVYNNAKLSNCGVADSTFLSGGTMYVSNGGVANGVRVLREAKLQVNSGAVAADVFVASGGNVIATVTGGDTKTAIDGSHVSGSFYLSNGTASNFLISSTGQLLVSNGGIALDATVKFGGFLTVLSGGTALDVTVSSGGHIRFTLSGNDNKTVVRGVNERGSFSLSGGVASNFIIYDGYDTQEIRSGGTACNTLVTGVQGYQYIYDGAVASATSVGRNGCLQINDGGSAVNAVISSGGSMKVCDGARVSGVLVSGLMSVESGTAGADESGGVGTISDVTIAKQGLLQVTKDANFGGTITFGGSAALTGKMTLASGAQLVFDLSERTAADGVILNDWQKVVIGGTIAISIDDATADGTYKLAANARAFGATSVAVKYGTDGIGALSVGGNLTAEGMSYSLALGSDVLEFTVTDVGPELGGAPVVTVNVYDITVNWDSAVDRAGVAKYVVRIDGAEQETIETGLAFRFKEFGDHTCQIQAIDVNGNASVWSEAVNFTVVDVTPSNLTLSATGASWNTTPSFEDCVAELSADGFQTVLPFAIGDGKLDFYNLAAGSYKLQVRAAVDDAYAVSNEVAVGAAETGAVVFDSDADAVPDAFFAQSNETWSFGYYAKHTGTSGWSGGTGEIVSLEGKNRIANVFRGSDDASILFLSDDANGDALALDDIFTARPTGEESPIARFAGLDEVRAGRGDDVVDLTSTEFNAVDMTIRGGDGDDRIWSGDGQNRLFGDAGNDHICGGAGNDVICGGAGYDRMQGGGGSDIFTFADNWGHDTVAQTGEGEITLWFAEGITAADVEVAYENGGTVVRRGDNSVTVSGRELAADALRFGAAGYEAQYAELEAMGAFADFSCAGIFDKREKLSVIAALS